MATPHLYLLCNTAAASYRAVGNVARARHAVTAAANALSTSVSPDGTRSVLKVARTARGLSNAPAVIQDYTYEQLDDLKAAMAAIAPLHQWSNP